MLTRVYLIRHGQATWNAEGRYIGASDPPLSELGRRQAERVAGALQAVPLRAVYASARTRARQTAEIVAAPHALSVTPMLALAEYGAGVWEGLTTAEIEAQHPAVLRQWYADPARTRIPEGETLEELRARVLPAFSLVRARHPGESIAVVAHGGVNKAIILDLLGAALNRYWRLRQDNACINLLAYDGDAGKVLVLNETSHLK